MALFALACGSAPPPVSPYRLAASDRPFVIDPSTGYEAGLGADRRSQARTYHLQLTSGLVDEVDRAAAQWEAQDPGLLLVAVLRAQVDFLRGDYLKVLERLDRVVETYPQYTAARLLEGRAAEISGDLERAHAAYGSVALLSAISAERMDALVPKLSEVLIKEIDDALVEADLFEAEALFLRLQTLAPEREDTFEARYHLARTTGDEDEELLALRSLAEVRDLGLERLIRRGELEVERGDPMASVSIFQSLLENEPDNLGYRDALSRAKFRWRLRVLPEEIQALTAEPELNRGQYGRMLFWILPGVRTARISAGSIAVDLVEHPHQKELVRVLNLGLLQSDTNLRSFFPDQFISRSEVLVSLLRYRRGENSCSREFNRNQRPSLEATCQAAVQCGLLRAESDCLPRASLSGSEALNFLRLTLSPEGALPAKSSR